MKKYSLILVVLFFAIVGNAQLNNSWIDYSKTYYKFKISSDNLNRISQTVLSSIGLGSTPVQNFQLWRNGKEVRLFTSVASGTLSASDYLEFWGEKNDGLPDKNLYFDSTSQLNPKYSLFTDTATYYLTVNSTSSNLRYTQTNNPVSGNVLPAEAYFMRKVEKIYKEQINTGISINLGENVYSSSFDLGEGWTSNESTTFSIDFLNINKYAAGPANSVMLTVTAFGNRSSVTRNLGAKINGIQVLNTSTALNPLPYMSYHRDTVKNLPLSLIPSSGNLNVAVNAENSTGSDAIVLASVSVTYPAIFDFNNEKNFYFELPSSTTGNYLVINNFNNNGIAPILYDINNGKRFLGDISTPGQVKFVLPASSDAVRKFNLMSLDASNIAAVTQLNTKTFVNYALAANQGDYLIISNPALYNNGSGVNNVDLYRQYRATLQGGSFNSKIYDITELNEQFGFGIKTHPSAVRDFIRYANQQFTVKPKFVFLIGHGVSYNYNNAYLSDPNMDKVNLVPTFGWPPSDILLSTNPGALAVLTPIGRLGAVNGDEVGAYLQKMKQYEQAQQSNSQIIADKAWMKNFLHAAGGHTTDESVTFQSYLDGYKAIAVDTLMGANVETVLKTDVAAIEQTQSATITNLFQTGLTYISYFGHASSQYLAINMNYPENYNNLGKYPFFQISGCVIGDYYGFDGARLLGYNNMSLSEKYVFINQKGAIGVLASTHFGVTPFLNAYNTLFYNAFSKTMYSDAVGNQIKDVIQKTVGNTLPKNLDFLTRMNLEETNLHGDPALKINYFTKPDYVIEDQLVKFNPTIISVADGSFKLDIKYMNIGKTINDSIRVSVKQKLPNGTIKILYNQMVLATKYLDSLSLTVPINALTDKGLNTLIITLDDGNKIAELSETNNILSKDFYIFEDELRPIFPYNFSIVNTQNITYSASTANPLSTTRQYVMEIDTTELFNSPFKKTYTTNGVGGVIQFTPSNITFTDSTVYYWRTSITPTGTAAAVWNNFSFIYLASSTPGWNQSHYYQHLKSTTSDINLNTARKWEFPTSTVGVEIKNGVFPSAANQAEDFQININGGNVTQSACGIAKIIFNIYNPVGMKVVPNVINGSLGLYSSEAPCGPTRINNFQYDVMDQTNRINAVNFLNQVPNGYYVVVRYIAYSPQGSNTYAGDWIGDTSAVGMGSGKSLYHSLKNAGFTDIDSFNRPRAFNFIYKKGDNSFTPSFNLSTGIYDKIVLNANCPIITNGFGTITSPVYGPAKAWSKFHWRGNSSEINTGDSIKFDIIGVSSTGVETKLFTVDSLTKDLDISSINAVQYPYLKLKMYNKDTLSGTPYQLRYWRLNYSPVAEGAVAPNILFSMKDTVQLGELINFKLAFKNISNTAFDSTMLFKFTVTDNNGIAHILNVPKGKILIAGDTLVVQYNIDTKYYVGNNTLYVDVNPNNNQPEQFHFNNILIKNFFVKGDTYNPLLDVTFDGTHILNKDIVAAKPHIYIKLKDENMALALSDTSVLKVQVRFPDGTLHNYNFGDSLHFNPANLASGENAASIDFTPNFVLDGEYELIVSGKDMAGNKASALDYHVLFTIINKPMISNMLNYPNPFSTSTAFVFTVTGSQVPQNLRIQVLTITGKVVKEITKADLGTIHVGRNITDYKWDGTDTYGQKLANGVYLYRVVTNLNGKSLDSYKETTDKTDQYFNNGYGKMVILR